MVIWIYGMSGTGKTTLAEKLFDYLNILPWTTRHELSRNQRVLIDADYIRKTLNEDLGFSEKDKKENAKRIIHMCELLKKNELNSIVCCITPYVESRLLTM